MKRQFKIIVFISIVLNLTLGCSCSKEDEKEQPDWNKQRFSYYVPNKGTISNQYGIPVQAPTLVSHGSFSGDLVIAAGEGGYVVRVAEDGSTKWITDLGISTSMGKFITVTAQVVKVQWVGGVYTLDSVTGEQLNFEPQTLMAYSIPGVGRIQATEVSRFYFDDGSTLPDTFGYPRGFDVSGDHIAVADTFGHRIVLYKNKVKVKEIPLFYPGTAFFADADTIILGAEHANQVLEYKISTDQLRVVYSCTAHALFQTPATMETVKALEISGAITDPDTGFGTCAMEISGPNTLYSVNSARPNGTNYLMADTDNHRIIEVDSNGTLLREILYINQPVDMMIIP